MVWRTAGPARADSQWWRWHHDEWNSGRYATVTRPPGAIRDGRWRRGSLEATFTAPGGTWYSGTVAAYIVRAVFAGGRTKTTTMRPSGPAGATQHVAVPAGARTVVVQAVNTAGLLGTPIRLR
jgi:hypothetical protein